jgi:mRNA interferase HigB
MRIIARRTLREFVQSRAGHKDQTALKAALDAWFDEVRKARWSSTADVRRRYATASVVSAERIVFKSKASIQVPHGAAGPESQASRRRDRNAHAGRGSADPALTAQPSRMTAPPTR